MPKRKPAITNEEIGALIRAARHKAGLKQDELGDKLGLSFQQVQRYETGKAGVSAQRLVQIADALGCKTLDLLPEACA